MRFDAYLFDLYGTLVDIHTDEEKASLWRKLAVFFSDKGAQYDAGQLKEAFHAESEKLFHESKAAFPEIDLGKVFLELYRKKGTVPDEKTIAETAWFFRRSSTTHLRLYAGAREFLVHLRKRGKVILLSNAQALFTGPELDHLGIRDLFDAVYLSSDYGCRKPDPGFFAVPFQRDPGLIPERCVMIGNDVSCDIDGAKRAGMRAFYIRSALSPKGDTSDNADWSLDGMDLDRVRRILTAD